MTRPGNVFLDLPTLEKADKKSPGASHAPGDFLPLIEYQITAIRYGSELGLVQNTG
jgi:hypothetical protein